LTHQTKLSASTPPHYPCYLICLYYNILNYVYSNVAETIFLEGLNNLLILLIAKNGVDIKKIYKEKELE